MERTSYAPGTPSWVDLGSPDVDKAAAFYRGLFGWEITEPGPVEETGGYRMAQIGGKPVAGLGPASDPGPPRWTTYVTVDDADKAVTVAKENGGSVFLEPMDVLTAGRMAVMADPTGAAIAVWQPNEHIGANLVNEPNTLCWNELSTRDLETAKSFYAAVFGWGYDGSPEYTQFTVGGESVGGMMTTPAEVPAEVPSHWLVYFAVADHDAAVAKATSLGGSVTAGPMAVEGTGTFSVLTDDQGATFAVIQMAEQG